MALKEGGAQSDAEVAPGSPEDAKRLLEGAMVKYRSFPRYSDAGELVVAVPGTPPVASPFRIAFERPNRLAVVVHSVQGTWSSTSWEAVCSGDSNPFPDQRLVRPLPDRIDFDWIANDYLGGLFTEPIGVPIQLELLLSDKSVAALSDPQAKTEFLQRDAADGRPCDRVQLELQGLKWIFWIDRADQLLRRMEMPPRLFYPGISDDQLAGIRCEIHLNDANAGSEIDWSRWQIPSRPNDVSVRRMVMPPPILSTQVLGATLDPFDLKSSDGTVLLDAAEPKKPISVICWIDDSAISEGFVRELLAFHRSLVEQQLGGRCGVYLVRNKDAQLMDEVLKKWNCDLPLAVDAHGLAESHFHVTKPPSLFILDRTRRIQVAETITSPVSSAALLDLIRRIDDKQDLASRQLQQDADNQARFIAALHRVAIDQQEAKKLDSLREFQFALHGMRRAWRTELITPLVSAAGAWYPGTATTSDVPTGYPFSGDGKAMVMSALDELGKIWVFDDLGIQSEVGQVEIEQADGAQRIQMAIEPWLHKWIAIVPEGLPRYWIVPSDIPTSSSSSPIRPATTFNTPDTESPVAFAWSVLASEPALAIATSESRLLVINPKTEERMDASGDSAMAIVPSLDKNGQVVQWSALNASGRLTRIRNLSGALGPASQAPIEARLDQLTFLPRPGNWLWGQHLQNPITVCLAGLPSGETGIVVCDLLHQALRSRPITVRPEQARLLSCVRLPDGMLYCLATGPNRVLHLFTADLQIMDQVCFNSRILGGALYADGTDLRLVVALDNEVSAWFIDVPDRVAPLQNPTTPTSDAVAPAGQ
jgi:hypothetical protein